ncbi:MAG: DUF4239 domain-containing protein [Gemmataceae bacterium]|nr:DUF4239 domain-containing protein [Gemmataceae bacterium]
MSNWVYELPTRLLALGLIFVFEFVALVGLYFARRYLLPRLRYHDGVNDAVSGTIQSIGVFYGITVGLIAVNVWNNYSNVASIASQEAATISMLYRDAESYPGPVRDELQARLLEYTQSIIDKEWPGHRIGQVPMHGANILTQFQKRLATFEPTTDSQRALLSETWRTFNQLIERRRMRMDAVTNSLSGIMWSVIWIGAAINISVSYFFYFEDWKLHAIMVGLTAGFLAIAVFLILANDRPFMGETGVSPQSFQLLIDTVRKIQ